MDPPERGARRALADLEIAWGQPQVAWEALRALSPDTASASVWEDFGDRAMNEERFGLARDAFGAAVRVRRTPALALKAAKASLRAGSPADVFTLAPLSEAASDPARVAREYLPLHVEALAALGRGTQAEALVAKYDRYPPARPARAPGSTARDRMGARRPTSPRARESLRSAGADADSSDAAGLLASTRADSTWARRLLRGSQVSGVPRWRSCWHHLRRAR
jgi:hypothetical protein